MFYISPPFFIFLSAPIVTVAESELESNNDSGMNLYAKLGSFILILQAKRALCHEVDIGEPPLVLAVCIDLNVLFLVSLSFSFCFFIWTFRLNEHLESDARAIYFQPERLFRRHQ